jgi:hypothetical protein
MRSQTRIHAGITAFAVQLPEDLSALSDEDLQALLDQATSDFDEVRNQAGDAPSGEQLDSMEELSAQIISMREEGTRRADEATARAERLAGLTEAVHPAGEEAETEDGAAAEGAEAGAEEGAEAETEESIAASAAGAQPPAARPSLSAAASRAPRTPTRPRNTDAPRFSLVASAGTGGFEAGQDISFLEAAKIFESRRNGFRGATGRQSFSLASIRIPFPENLTASTLEADEVLAYAADESRLDGGSLTAAGVGWGAPSEVLYDVPDDGSSLDGLVSVPEINVARGGVRFTKGADFASVYDDGFYQTEAQNIAGDQKTFVEIPNPDFEEERLDATGVGVKSGILQRIGFPESIEQFLRQTMVGHQHRVSAKTISKMVAGATPLTGVGSGVAASITILNVLAFQAMDMRYRHVLPENETMEVLLPFWAKEIVKADYAKRNAVDNPLEVDDALIARWFALRNLAPQYTYDWQSNLTAGPANSPGASAPATDYPANVQALMYRAGTYVRGLEDVITINGLYDSALLADNKELALFTEQGLLVAKRGFDSRVVTIPVAADGQSGAQAAFATNL